MTSNSNQISSTDGPVMRLICGKHGLYGDGPCLFCETDALRARVQELEDTLREVAPLDVAARVKQLADKKQEELIVARALNLIEDIEQFCIAVVHRRACDGCTLDDALVEIQNKIAEFDMWYAQRTSPE